MSNKETFLQENKFKKTLKEYIDLQEKAREAGNAANRKKTELSKVVNAFLTDNELPVGTAIQVNDKLYKYAATESSVFTYDAWRKAYEAGDLTENQFIEGLSVSKSLASRYLGEDVVRRLEVKTTGKKADLRIEDLADGYAISSFNVIKPKAKLVKRKLIKTNLVKNKIRVLG